MLGVKLFGWHAVEKQLYLPWPFYMIVLSAGVITVLSESVRLHWRSTKRPVSYKLLCLPSIPLVMIHLRIFGEGNTNIYIYFQGKLAASNIFLTASYSFQIIYSALLVGAKISSNSLFVSSAICVITVS